MQKKPNIIFFFSDQQRWDTVGCYGQKLQVTPNLDRMAAEGVRFEHAFSVQPVCGPSRACLQTGKYATEIGCYRNNIALPQDTKTLAEYMSEAGYETGYIGKWHLASTGNPTAQTGKSVPDNAPATLGRKVYTEEVYRTKPVPPHRRGGYRDFWLAADALEHTSHGYGGYLYNGDMNRIDFKGYRADCLTDYALDYLRSRNGVKPFFLFLSYLEPHHQNDRNRYEGPEGSKERFKDFEVPGDLGGVEGDWKENFPDYLGCCSSLDTNLGRIREELVKLGMDKNTLIIYTSDHGSHFRTRNEEYKRSCHEASIHVPMIISGPGFEGGKVISELVSLIDLPSTILACAEVEKPHDMRGNPLQKLLEGDDANWPREVFVQISESQVGRAIRTEKWKYSVRAFEKNGWLDDGSDVYEEEFLYDLENDPYERINLVRDISYKAVRSQLAKVLIRRMREAGESVPEILPANGKQEEVFKK